MKVENPFPVVAAIDGQERRAPAALARRAAPGKGGTAAGGSPQLPRETGKAAGFSIQLNQQLSAIQSAESYLGELAERLGQLKLSLGRELGSAQGSNRKALDEQLGQTQALLDQRSQRSAGGLDANFDLRLHEPARTRFSIDGLATLDQVRDGGRETLLINSAGKQSEPGVVVLDDAMSDQQLLRSFNLGLAGAGIRAEIGGDGKLTFTIDEEQWQRGGGELSVKGEGKRFAKDRVQSLKTRAQRLLDLPDSVAASAPRELRQMLDQVIDALDRIGTLRDQLRQRQTEIREFLARQAGSDERQWAQDYAETVFNLVRQSGSSYAAATQTVVAQANLTRFTVVSLLS